MFLELNLWVNPEKGTGKEGKKIFVQGLIRKNFHIRYKPKYSISTRYSLLKGNDSSYLAITKQTTPLPHPMQLSFV